MTRTGPVWCRNESPIGQPPTYVPNRNVIFLAPATAYAESHGVADVYYGAQRHDMYGYWDTTLHFLQQMNQVYALNRKTPITIKAPFVTWSKADILRAGLQMEIDYSQTWSCYQGKELACGRCPTCTERLTAFVDSLVFPTLAFGSFLWPIVLGQFAAKTLGGFVWSLVFRWLDRRAVVQAEQG